MATLLGIDTSCDDTGVGVVTDGRVRSNVVVSQTALHARFGGVVPEEASREHLGVIDGVVAEALVRAQVALSELDGVAATYGPGLVGALLVGLNYAKGLAWARGLPFIAVHHLEGHIASSTAGSGVRPPFLCLIASGGHTSLFEVRAWGSYHLLGRTRDDAAGEAFDKVARLLGLGYPGGPPLSALAQQGNDRAFPLPVPLRHQEGFDFSFSGLKTAVSLLLGKNPDAEAADVAATFERIVVASLVRVTRRAAAATGLKDLVVAGGVAANRRLQAGFRTSGLRVHFPPPELTTDNGAMIALAAERHLGHESDWSADAEPYAPLALPSRARAPSRH